MQQRPIPRPSARILLVDVHDRILLFRGFGTARDPRPIWITPGGGVRAGEPLPEAAARELREETGLAMPPEALGPVVAVSAGPWTSDDGRLFEATDSYFFVRVPQTAVDVSGMEQLERSLLDTFRWWPIADLAATAERVIPHSLPALLGPLLTGPPPAEPVVIPWHHPHPAG